MDEYTCPECGCTTNTLSEYRTYICDKCKHETWDTHERQAEMRGRELQNILDIIDTVQEAINQKV